MCSYFHSEDVGGAEVADKRSFVLLGERGNVPPGRNLGEKFLLILIFRSFTVYAATSDVKTWWKLPGLTSCEGQTLRRAGCEAFKPLASA